MELTTCQQESGHACMTAGVGADTSRENGGPGDTLGESAGTGGGTDTACGGLSVAVCTLPRVARRGGGDDQHGTAVLPLSPWRCLSCIAWLPYAHAYISTPRRSAGLCDRSTLHDVRRQRKRAGADALLST